MKIVCVGGGPAGLTFAALAKLRDPDRDVTVVERNPRGVTYGWGVGIARRLLPDLQRADPVLGTALRDIAVVWQDQLVQLGDLGAAHLGSYGYSVSRQRLLDLLEDRARQLGVRIEHDRTLDTDDLPDADLVVVSDGVHSPTRQRLAAEFRPTVTTGDNMHLWVGSPRAFETFTFGFERTDAGWICFHGYRYAPDGSTLIVECRRETYLGLGFDRMSPPETLASLQRIFDRYLRGEPLRHHASGQAALPWGAFADVTNERWVHGNLALMGDAAHTTHFSIGSGTAFAMQDAINLADQLESHRDLSEALAAYDRERREALAVEQTWARNSQRWFESIDENAALGPVEFGWSMLNRRWGGPPPSGGQARRRRLYLATQVPPLRLARQAATAAGRTAHERRLSRASARSAG